jgi:large subunit ribosomal protein L5
MAEEEAKKSKDKPAGEGKPHKGKGGDAPKGEKGKDGGKGKGDAPKGEKGKGDAKGKGDGKPKAPPPPSGPARLQERYKKEIAKSLAQKLGRDNPNSLPRLQKICVNMGVGKALQDKNRMEQAAEQLTAITGQRAQVTKARVAVSGFRLREGNEIGCRVTLRGKRMYEFLDRLISIALPRIRDFRGVNPKSFDGNGNYTMGLAEQAVFPEIDPDKMTFSQGMDVTIVTSTHSDDEARELLRFFGMPFREA